MSEPVFDHGKSTGETSEGDGRYLTQDGELFTFGEWNRQLSKYVPEPKWVPRGQKSFDELKAMANAVRLDIRTLQRSIDAFTEAVNTKIELGGTPPGRPVSTSPYEDAYLQDLPPIPDLVEPPVAEEVNKKKRVTAPRKRSGGRPKKVMS